MKWLDDYLNKTAMYYLVVRGLAGLAALSILFGYFKLLPWGPIPLLITFGVLIVTCYFSNKLFAKIFKAEINHESSVITALILFFILAPVRNLEDIEITILAGVLAMGSKYIFAINKKHIFNPAAISILILDLLGFGNGIWWVGSAILLPFVLIMGLMTVRKIRRFYMFFTFLTVALITIGVFNKSLEIVMQSLLSWPLIFFGTVMLTEPQTTPPHRKTQIAYGGLVGLLFGSQFAFGPIYSSPELALVTGNIFSFIISPKQKLFLKLKDKREIGPGIWEFTFPGTIQFKPGQYLEWTLPHKNPDTRGVRRYFSVASRPGEDIKIAVRMAKEKGSSFKNALLGMNPGDQIIAGGLSGDFILPENGKFAFIAGGIGITPFRSMSNQKKDAILFYAVTEENDLVYKDDFNNFKLVPVITSKQGYLTEEIITEEAPDYKERIFFLSGPPAMVDSYKSLLRNMGVSTRFIKTDFFPGY